MSAEVYKKSVVVERARCQIHMMIIISNSIIITNSIIIAASATTTATTTTSHTCVALQCGMQVLP